jgi:hypothetical protein
MGVCALKHSSITWLCRHAVRREVCIDNNVQKKGVEM